MSKLDDLEFHSTVSDVSLTDSEINVQEFPVILNASSPSSICSTKPLEWDSGADVGYCLIPNDQSNELSTIERMAVNNFMITANSTPIDFSKENVVRRKSNSLSNLVDVEFSKNNKSVSCDQLQRVSEKPNVNTLLKNKSPVTSSLSSSTIVQKSVESKQEIIEKTSISSINESKSSESTSTNASVVSSESCKLERSCGSTNTTTDRVNSFEYFTGNIFCNSKQNYKDCSNKETEECAQLLIEAMKQFGITDKSKIKEVFRNMYKKIKESKNRLIEKSLQDSNNLHEFQDTTPQTSNTGNTVLNNEIDNHSSIMPFSSPVTSSQYDDSIDTSRYCDTNSLESGRHLNLKESKLKKLIPVKHSVRKVKINCSDASKQFDKQNLKFHETLKLECENLVSSINNQVEHLNNLNKFLNTHKEFQKNWNTFKQKQILDRKPKFRKKLVQQNNTISTQTDTTTSCYSSKYNSTETESSSTICQHTHYKKGVLVNNPMSLVQCCKNTINLVEKKKLPKTTQQLKSMSIKFKTGQLKDDNKTSLFNAGTYTVYKPVRTTNFVTTNVRTTKNSKTYDFVFKPNQKENLVNCESRFMSNNKVNNMKNKKTLHSVSQLNIKTQMSSTQSLQEYLAANRPDYIARAQQRQNTLNELQKLREKRKQLKKEFLLTNSEKVIPPNPLTIKRIMTQKEMRKQTENKYKLCSEIKNKKIEKKRKEEYMAYRNMANIFNKKLQMKTLKGNVDLSNSVSVCSL